jgi:Tfp pilus assembly ATPase PilU
MSQRLLLTRKEGLRPAVEILRGTPVAQKFIVEDKLSDLRDYIDRGESGMQSFDQHILKMYREELISGTEALRWATKPETLAMAIRGVGGSNQRATISK